jgi:hypothetical protein
MRRLFGLVVMLAALATAPATAQAAILPGQTIDGPSTDIKEFGNIDVAPDGTGALVYRKNVGGAQRVFVSRIANGAFGPPERADDDSTNVASRPRVAASNGGKLVVVWLGAAGMGTQLVRGAVSAGSGQPFQLANVASGADSWISADVDANPNGQAYATATQNFAAFNVHAFRLDGTAWTQVGAGPLDNNSAVKAGGSMAQDEPRIAVTSDGNAVVAWPEGNDGNPKDVLVRRLTGTTPGSVITATIPTLSGASRANTAFMVDIDAEGNNAWVAFREDFAYGATDRARVLARRLVGGAFETAQVVDPLPLTGPTNGAEDPSLAVNDAGQGLVTTRGQLTAEGNGAALAGGTWSQVGRLDSPPSDNVPLARTAIGDNGAGLFLIAHRATNASPFTAQARTYVNGQLGPITPVNDTALGSIAEGLELTADANGNGYVGYMQSADAGTTNRIAAAIVDGPPPPPPQNGGGGGGGGGGGTGPTPDTDVPHVTGTKLFPSTFAIGRGTPGSLNPSAVRVGTTIRFVVSEDARVRFLFERPTVGRRAGSRCVKTTRRNRARRRCTRWVRDGAFTLNRKAGLNRVKFNGRLSARRKLRLGKHRVTLTPTDAAGNVGAFQRRPLKIVKRR